MQSAQCFAMAAPVAPVVLPAGTRTSASARAAFRPAASRQALKQRVQLRAIAQEASGATGWLTGGVLLHRRQRVAGRRRRRLCFLLLCCSTTCILMPSPNPPIPCCVPCSECGGPQPPAAGLCARAAPRGPAQG